MQSIWKTKQGIAIFIDRDFIESYTITLSNNYDPDFSLTSAYYGQAALPFLVGVIVGIANLSLWKSIPLIMIGGLVSIIQSFFKKDIFTFFLRMAFSFFTFLTKGWGFIAVPIIISIVQKDVKCVLAFLIAFVLLTIAYWVIGSVSKKHSMSKYGFTSENALDVWDYECLRTVYSVARSNGTYRMRFIDFVDQYRYYIQNYAPMNTHKE